MSHDLDTVPTQLDALTKRSLESVPEEEEEEEEEEEDYDSDYDLLDLLDFLLAEDGDDTIFRRTGALRFHLDVWSNMLIRVLKSLIRCPWYDLTSDRNIVQPNV